ncbi:ribosomal protein L6 [Hamiltosporidium tvaerminnensis]|uniref:Ribosomal protein L6 n=2 Tax=Hamiltosporidium TaxID=1176354 RepID=A0A4Q9LIT8_9MICR|nr:ribosomal protein L6 [Hamiltosporidium tvaerminnensis]TBU07171.1 ribosomal protein L6 [Hamiltosporidium magnivora]TBU09906.1 ribosomal protein L6 [Hamiltosporidium magnivora]TBU20801.1 ribosomal protein L6 [Hamiltosporidium tvaerminnensis]
MIRRIRLNPEDAGFYPADDLPEYVEKLEEQFSLCPTPPYRKDLVKGNIVVVLDGEFISSRIIFLKQLPNYMALCIGPFNINKVPLFKIHEKYLLKTSTILDIRCEFHVRENEIYESKVGNKKQFNSNEHVQCDQEKEIQEYVMRSVDNFRGMKGYLAAPFKLPKGFSIPDIKF